MWECSHIKLGQNVDKMMLLFKINFNKSNVKGDTKSTI